MDPWIIYTLLATLLYGVLNFLFKAAAERGHDPDGLVNIVGLTVAILAFGTLLATTGTPATALTRDMLVYAFFNGLFFALGSLSKMAALKRAPAAVVFPLNRLNTVGVMLIGILFFAEAPRPLQWLGIAAGLGVLGLIVFEPRGGFSAARRAANKAGIALAAASAFFTALSMTVGKLLAESPENRLAYIGASYTLVFLFTLGRQTASRRRGNAPAIRPGRERLLFGGAIGGLNFAGYFLVLQAFGSGPISLSQAIFSSSILIPILLSRWLYHERFTPARTAALALAVLSVVLISWT
jgi:drug/metabolite transporter (DMT)-like permease